ncbi:MAG: glycosyltransferase family 4 protein [Microthrixaceae bacterium]
MKILMITKFLPLPADSGGKQRSAAVLRRLAGIGDVTICAFDDGRADHDELARLGVRVCTAPRPGNLDALLGSLRHRSVSAGRFASRALRRQIIEAATPRPDCLVVAYGQLAPYAADVDAGHKVLDLHNVESALLRSYAASRTSPRSILARYESRAMGRLERLALGAFDTVSVVSDVDRTRLPEGVARVLVCPNGCEPAPPLPMGEDAVVAFVGLFGWAPNAEAAVWFTERVWPLVRRQVSGARLLLVGRDPTDDVRALARPDVVVTGAVPEVEPYLASARVAVAPLRAGGGSRLKIIEALRAGRPVVATTIGAEGLEELIGNGLITADDASEFADAVVDLLRDRERAAALGRAGNEAVLRRFSWDQTLAPLVDDVRGQPRG